MQLARMLQKGRRVELVVKPTHELVPEAFDALSLCAMQTVFCPGQMPLVDGEQVGGGLLMDTIEGRIRTSLRLMK